MQSPTPGIRGRAAECVDTACSTPPAGGAPTRPSCSGLSPRLTYGCVDWFDYDNHPLVGDEPAASQAAVKTAA